MSKAGPLNRKITANKSFGRVGNVPQQNALLFDHLVDDAEQRGWHLQAERISGLEVDTQFEFSRLLDWKVGRQGPLENLVDKVAAT